MKRDQSKKQEQNIKTEQKVQPIIRVRSGLRAGLEDNADLIGGCC
jgi:hypothetical protein